MGVAAVFNKLGYLGPNGFLLLMHVSHAESSDIYQTFVYNFGKIGDTPSFLNMILFVVCES